MAIQEKKDSKVSQTDQLTDQKIWQKQTTRASSIILLLDCYMSISASEREVIGLCIVCEAIEDIVNHALLDIRNVEESPNEATAYFPNAAHQQLFLIRLLDFAKEGGDSTLTGVKGACLDVLSAACVSRSFDVQGSIAPLQEATERLNGWLHTPTTLKLWLPTIDIEVDLHVPRLQLLFISGNQAKHNVSRLTGLARNIQKMLKSHGHDVSLEQVPLALDDFREHLNGDFFVYYGTWLAELINEVRWGLQQYLLPTFQASYRLAPEIDDMAYRYEYPASIEGAIPRSWFWRLMNHIRSGPYVKRFRTAEHFKIEHLW